MPWDSIVDQISDLLPPTPEGDGRASLPVRMMVGLLYLKYADNLSDDQVLERWLESPTMQYFTGEVYFQHELPCDPSSLTRWRRKQWDGLHPPYLVDMRRVESIPLLTKRRQAVEPSIGHLEADHRMRRTFLRGVRATQ